MKKVFFFMFCLFVLAGLWAGGQTAASGSPATSSEPTVIDLWIYPSINEAGPPPPDWKVPQVLKERFNIDLKFTMMPSNNADWDVKVLATAAANALPDVVEMRRAPWEQIVRMGLLAPVDDLYPLMPNRSKLMYTPEGVAYTTLNGKSYALGTPGSFEKKEGMLVRKDWLDKLGLKVPVTTEDWFNVMKAFTLNDPDGNGRADTYGYGAFIELLPAEEGLGRRFDPFFGAFGVAGTWNMTKANAGLNVRKSAYYDAMVYVKRIIDERVIDPNWTSYVKDDYRAAWKQGRFGMMREDSSAYSSENNYAPFDKNFPNGEWLPLNPPVGPAGLSSVGTQTPVWQLNAVSATAAKAGKGPAIAKMMEWFSSDEGYYLTGWGVEGVNFVKDERGIPTDKGLPDPSKFFTRPEIVTITQARRLVFYNSDVELLARYPDYLAPTSRKPISTMAVIREYAKAPWTNSAGADTLPKPSADLQRFYEQGVLEFITGQRELNRQNWTAWVAEFDRVGGLDWEKAGIAAAEAAGYLK